VEQAGHKPHRYMLDTSFKAYMDATRVIESCWENAYCYSSSISCHTNWWNICSTYLPEPVVSSKIINPHILLVFTPHPILNLESCSGPSHMSWIVRDPLCDLPTCVSKSNPHQKIKSGEDLIIVSKLNSTKMYFLNRITWLQFLHN
jgi:hypothetical protein